MVVKTVGLRDSVDKEGKRKKVTGNVYLHFLTSCLREYKSDFNFTMLSVPKSTQERLQARAKDSLKTRGIVFDEF